MPTIATHCVGVEQVGHSRGDRPPKCVLPPRSGVLWTRGMCASSLRHTRSGAACDLFALLQGVTVRGFLGLSGMNGELSAVCSSRFGEVLRNTFVGLGELAVPEALAGTSRECRLYSTLAVRSSSLARTVDNRPEFLPKKTQSSSSVFTQLTKGQQRGESRCRT